MLNLWRTTRPIFGCSKRHFRSHSKFGNRNRSGLTKRALSTLQSASASNFTITPLLLLGGAIGAGLSTVVYVTQRPETRPSAEEEETPALTPQPAKLSHMSPDSLFIVGSASYPGKTDGNAMLIPHQLLSGVKVKDVSIGDQDGWLIDSRGKLQSWSQIQKPTVYPQLSRYSFTQVKCGKDGFTAALQSNGSMWVRFNDGEDFVLINKGDLKKKYVAKLAVGAHHVAALTTDGSLYTLGNNDRGQCGILELSQSPGDNPHLITWNEKFTDVDTGLHHTVAITSDGKVVGFGYNKNLQLGQPQEWVRYETPETPLVPFGSYAEMRTAERIRLRNKTWADQNEYITQYAHPVPRTSDYFTKLGSKATRVVCGDEFTFIFDDRDRAYGFGDGSKGQLAKKPHKSFVSPSLIHRAPFDRPSQIKHLSCGSAHCVAMTNNGDIWSWGLNLHGECGRQSKLFTPTPVIVPVENEAPIETVICSKSSSAIIL